MNIVNSHRSSLRYHAPKSNENKNRNSDNSCKKIENVISLHVSGLIFSKTLISQMSLNNLFSGEMRMKINFFLGEIGNIFISISCISYENFCHVPRLVPHSTEYHNSLSGPHLCNSTQLNTTLLECTHTHIPRHPCYHNH